MLCVVQEEGGGPSQGRGGAAATRGAATRPGGETHPTITCFTHLLCVEGPLASCALLLSRICLAWWIDVSLLPIASRLGVPGVSGERGRLRAAVARQPQLVVPVDQVHGLPALPRRHRRRTVRHERHPSSLFVRLLFLESSYRRIRVSGLPVIWLTSCIDIDINRVLSLCGTWQACGRACLEEHRLPRGGREGKQTLPDLV